MERRYDFISNRVVYVWSRSFHTLYFRLLLQTKCSRFFYYFANVCNRWSDINNKKIFPLKNFKMPNDRIVLVDDDDYEKFKKFNWSGDLYACRKTGKYLGNYKYKWKTIWLHREIMSCPKDQTVDHINGNTLDNRKENLRICSFKENSFNRARHGKNTSGYKGVSTTRQGTYRAYCYIQKKQIHLGIFPSAIRAAQAYDTAAIKHYGEFACTNFGEQSREY